VQRWRRVRVDLRVQGARAGGDARDELAEGAQGGEEREDRGGEPRDLWRAGERAKGAQEEGAEEWRKEAESEEEELDGAEGGSSKSSGVRGSGRYRR
jgi:hypothetical protein